MKGYGEGVDWTELAYDIIHYKHLVNTATNFRVTQKMRNYQSSWITVSFSRSIEVGIFASGSERVRNYPIQSTVDAKQMLKRMHACCRSKI